MNYAPIIGPQDLPTDVNWTAAGAVTPVKNQGDCGSCWSFSTTGALEGLNVVSGNALASFSEQQLMDCSRKYGNKACQGGMMDDAFEYVQAAGIETEDSYPYKARDDLTCHYNAALVVFNITGHTDVDPMNITALMTAVAGQPVSIAVEADQSSWQLYSGGVITSNCGQVLDHGVLVVGYGTDSNNTDYWNVKNSWGEDWGMAGYLLIERSDANLCGVLNQPSFPTL
jgi:C1A family cysteine protease